MTVQAFESLSLTDLEDFLIILTLVIMASTAYEG